MARTVDHRSSGRPRVAPNPPERAAGKLAVVLITGILLAGTLWRIAGPPALPDGSAFEEVRATLAGSELTDTQIIAAGTSIAWILISYVALTVSVRAVLVLAERATGGARWVRTALRVSQLLTIPAVRRVVDGGVAGVLLVSGSLVGPARAIAAAPDGALDTIVLRTPSVVAGGELGHAPPSQQRERVFIPYTVQRGDSLWGIAQRLYGDGGRYLEIFDANRERDLGGDTRWVDPRVIQPGWVLMIPAPAERISVEGTTTYRVAQGDDLWSIAARFLGDGFRWVEIFELNRGQDMGDGRSFRDSSRIYPGWALELPLHPISNPAGIETPHAPTLEPSPPTGSPAPLPTVTRVESTGSVAQREPGLDWTWPAIPRAVGTTAAGFVLLAGTALFVHRLRPARSTSRPVAASEIGDAGRVALATAAMSAALSALGLRETRIVALHESRRALICVLAAPPAESEVIGAHQHDLAERVGCDVRVSPGTNGTVELSLVGFHRLAASVLAPERAEPEPMVPVGASADAITYLNVATEGVGIAVDESTAQRLIRAWVATLATTHEPERLILRVDSETVGLLGDVDEAPHFAGTAGHTNTDTLVEELDELVRVRLANKGPGCRIVAFVRYADRTAHRIDELLRVGPSANVFVVAVAASTDLKAFAATVRSNEVELAEHDEPVSGATPELVLQTGRHEWRLAPVHVRRDASMRWHDVTHGDAEVPPSRQVSVPAGMCDPEDIELECWPEGDQVVSPVLDPESLVPRPALDIDATPRLDSGKLPIPDERSASVAVAPRPIPFTPAPQERSSAPQATIEAPSRFGSRQLSMFAGMELAETDTDEATVDALFSIRCLGGFEVRAGDSPVAAWTYQRAPELLAVLLVHGSPISGQRIAETLWPEVPWDASLKHNVSNIASSIRSALRNAAGRPDLRVVAGDRQGRYRIDAEVFEVDLDVFELSLRQAQSTVPAQALDAYDRALALYTGEFLAGIPAPWADSYRVEFRQQFLDAAHRAAEIASEQGEAERAKAYWRLAMVQDPTDEIAARGLLRALADGGDVNGARKVYRVLCEAIQQELEDPEASPDPETRALMAAIVSESRDA